MQQKRCFRSNELSHRSLPLLLRVVACYRSKSAILYQLRRFDFYFQMQQSKLALRSRKRGQR